MVSTAQMRSLLKRFQALPSEIQEIIKDDMATAFENRIQVHEKIIQKNAAEKLC